MHVRNIKGEKYLYDANKYVRKVGLVDRFFLNNFLVSTTERILIGIVVFAVIFALLGILDFLDALGIFVGCIIFFVGIAHTRRNYERK